MTIWSTAWGFVKFSVENSVRDHSQQSPPAVKWYIIITHSAELNTRNFYIRDGVIHNFIWPVRILCVIVIIINSDANYVTHWRGNCLTDGLSNNENNISLRLIPNSGGTSRELERQTAGAHNTWAPYQRYRNYINQWY